MRLRNQHTGDPGIQSRDENLAASKKQLVASNFCGRFNTSVTELVKGGNAVVKHHLAAKLSSVHGLATVGCHPVEPHGSPVAHSVTSRNNDWMSDSSVFMSASISANERGGTYL